ncbi:MAG: class II glutamine amidotransferase [bacterium]
MCRLLAIKGEINQEELNLILENFQNQAITGRVPRGVTPGHQDGWGFSVYKKGQVALHKRSCKNASADFDYNKTKNKIIKINGDIIIGHLRKASVGGVNKNNAHPFVYKNYSFCQNGKVIDSEKIKIEAKFKKIIKGTTDSERLFYFILGQLELSKKLKYSFIQALKKIKNDFDYTAMNSVFSDGRQLLVTREINLKNEAIKKMKMVDYYSLFVGEKSDGSYKIIASEKMKIKNVKWRLLKNGEVIVI